MTNTIFTSIVTPNRLRNFMLSQHDSHFTHLISKTSILGSQNSTTDICWHPLAPPLPLPTLPGPSRDLPKNVQSEKWNHQKSVRFSSKCKPWLPFADPRPPKKGPNGPDQLSRGLPGTQLGRPHHFWSPPWTLLKSHWCHSKEKTEFLENRENIRICHVWGAWAATTRPPEH
jgi:hypothetical protein